VVTAKDCPIAHAADDLKGSELLGPIRPAVLPFNFGITCYAPGLGIAVWTLGRGEELQAGGVTKVNADKRDRRRAMSRTDDVRVIVHGPPNDIEFTGEKEGAPATDAESGAMRC
jgi:hypothetical protein